jgi:hypothetical protein
VPAHDLPAQRAVFAPGADPEMIAEVAARLRKQAGLPAQPSGVVAGSNGRAARKPSAKKPAARAPKRQKAAVK